MTGVPSIFFSRKAVVDQTYIRNTENIGKSIVGIDARQLYPFSMCQEMPTGLYTRWEFDSESQKFKARQIKPRKFGNMVMSYLQPQRPNCTNESYYTTGTQKKIDCFNVDGFCAHCKTIFEYLKQWVVTFTFVHVRKQEQVFQRKILREDSRNGNTMNYDETIFGTKAIN